MFGPRILTFLFIISPIFATSPCLTFIDNLELHKNAPNLQTPEEKNYFAYSGIKGRNDLGHKRKCEEDSTKRFYVIGEVIPGEGSTYNEYETGICVPDYCDKRFLESHSILLRLCNINNWNPISETLVLNDPHATPPRGPGFYVLAVIFYILIAICVFSTLIQNRDKIFKMRKMDAREVSPLQYEWFYKAFDAVANLKALYKTAEESGQSNQIATFGFLRTFSMLWVAGHHTVISYMGFYQSSGEWPASPPFIVNFLTYGSTAVGIFFFMAGFLAAYTLSLKASREKITISKFFSDFLHRLFKTYPGYWVAVFLDWIVVPGMLKGTLANKLRGQAPICGDRWIQKLFMIDNFMNPRCAVWTWYIDADTQTYPFVILLSYLFVSCIKKNSKYVAYLVTFILTGLSFASGLLSIAFLPHYNWYYYPFPRGVQIFSGIFFGFQYYEYSKLKLTNNFCSLCERSASFRFFWMTIGLILTVVGIALFKRDGDETEYGFGIMITLGLALFFVPLANNCKSYIKDFFNSRIFQIFGKLGMGFYLLHCLFVTDLMFTKENLQAEYSIDVIIYGLLKVILYGYLCSVLYHIALEKPLLNIEAHFSKRQGPNKPASVEPKRPSDGTFKPQISPDTPDSVRLSFDKGQQTDQEMEAGTNAEPFSRDPDSAALFVHK